MTFLTPPQKKVPIHRKRTKKQGEGASSATKKVTLRAFLFKDSVTVAINGVKKKEIKDGWLVWQSVREIGKYERGKGRMGLFPKSFKKKKERKDFRNEGGSPEVYTYDPPLAPPPPPLPLLRPGEGKKKRRSFCVEFLRCQMAVWRRRGGSFDLLSLR